MLLPGFLHTEFWQGDAEFSMEEVVDGPFSEDQLTPFSQIFKVTYSSLCLYHDFSAQEISEITSDTMSIYYINNAEIATNGLLCKVLYKIGSTTRQGIFELGALTQKAVFTLPDLSKSAAIRIIIQSTPDFQELILWDAIDIGNALNIYHKDNMLYDFLEYSEHIYYTPPRVLENYFRRVFPLSTYSRTVSGTLSGDGTLSYEIQDVDPSLMTVSCEPGEHIQSTNCLLNIDKFAPDETVAFLIVKTVFTENYWMGASVNSDESTYLDYTIGRLSLESDISFGSYPIPNVPYVRMTRIKMNEPTLVIFNDILLAIRPDLRIKGPGRVGEGNSKGGYHSCALIVPYSSFSAALLQSASLTEEVFEYLRSNQTSFIKDTCHNLQISLG